MNQKEINELRRRFHPERCSINHIYGCYVNSKKEIISRVDTSLSTLPQEETSLYLERLKKALSGTLGKNLIDIVFTTGQVLDSDEHRLLMALRDSHLEDPEIRENFYQIVVNALDMEDSNYLILLAADNYDVPHKGRDGDTFAEGSDQVFRYVICSICPVKDSGAALRYFHDESAFHSAAAGQIAGAAALGFIFPAFDNRSTNIHNALYYVQKPAQMHPEFIDAVFRSEEIPMSAEEQQTAFQTALQDALEQDCSFDLMQTVHEQLRERIEDHKSAKDPEELDLSTRELEDILRSGGVSEEKLTAFHEACEVQFGKHAVLKPDNLIDSGRYEIRTNDVKLSVNPEFSYLVEARVINGRKYLLVPAEGSLEINGIPVSFSGISDQQHEEGEEQGEKEEDQEDQENGEDQEDQDKAETGESEEERVPEDAVQEADPPQDEAGAKDDTEEEQIESETDATEEEDEGEDKKNTEEASEGDNDVPW